MNSNPRCDRRPETTWSRENGNDDTAPWASSYRELQVLREGPATRTLLAQSLADGTLVVIKAVLRRLMAAGLEMRFEQESKTRLGLEGSGLAPLRTFGVAGDLLYAIMPYVHGQSLASRVSRGFLGVRQAIQVGLDVFSALATLHGHGILHRNIKPENVIIEAGADSSHAVLVDFGHIPGASLTAVEERPLLETARYLSPEQAGSLDCDVGEPADLYSAGVMLFECLAGHPPFTGETVGQLLLQHMTTEVPDLKVIRSEIPGALDAVVQRLLRKDPRDRYQSAAAVVADLTALLQALDRGDREPRLAFGISDQRFTLTEPAFVARSRELGELEQLLVQAQTGRGGLISVEGESGSGKSRLLAELTWRAVQQGFRVFRGEGSDAGGQLPLQMLRGVVEDLAAETRAEPTLAARILERLGNHRDAVIAALPQLSDEFGWHAAPQNVPEAFGSARSVRGLVEFLASLGTRLRPAVVILDDCQWADELTFNLIEHWRWRQEPTDPDEGRVLLVLSFRSEEVPDEHPLRRIHPTGRLHLAPLDPNEIRQVAESMAGPLPDEAMDVVCRLSEGSPLMASAVLRGLVESGALVRQMQAWSIEPSAIPDLRSFRMDASLAVRRLDLLPGPTNELLSAGAILGKEFDLTVAAELAQLSPAEAVAALDDGRRRHLIWVRADGVRCVFVHDTIRADLRKRLPSSRCQAMHLHAAQVLAQRASHRISELAYHFDAAGHSDQALEYALEAAERARSQHALENAEQQYRIAQRGAAQAEPAIRYRIAVGLGDTLMLRGRYSAATTQFETAEGLAGGSFEQARIQGKQGELAFKRGDNEKAIRHFEGALRRLGKRVPRSRAAFLVLLLWEAAVQVLHTLLPSLLVNRFRRESPPAEVLAWRLFSRLAHAYWFSRGRLVAMWAHLRGMNAAERYPPTPELAQAYSEHAPGMTLIGCHRRGMAYAQKSFEIRESLGDLWGQGQSLHYHGVVLFAASRFAECIEKCREAVRLLERMGDYWEVHIARYQIAASLYYLGDFRAAMEETERNYRSGLELGDEQATTIILDVWARAVGRSLPQSILHAERQRRRCDAQATAQVLIAEGVRQISTGQFGEAVSTLQQAAEVPCRVGVRNAYTLPALAWLATALRCQAESCRDPTPRQRQQLLRQAGQAARQAIKAAWICQNDLPRALREYALIHAHHGHTRRARVLLDRAVRVADRQQARYERALTLFARGRIGRECGWPEAERQVAEAETILLALAEKQPAGGEPGLQAAGIVTLSLSDRFDTALESGRKVLRSTSPEGVFEEARTTALRLLRAEQCRVLQLDTLDHGQCAVRDAGAEEFPVDAISHAILLGRAQVFAEDVPSSQAEGSFARCQRSSLCVPIFVRGRAVACLYATHDHIRQLFGAHEEQLANFIATLAGAALENVEGFRQLQRLNETLEERVAQGTAAAELRAQELARSNQELQRVAHELTKTEGQLRIAAESAQAANCAKSQFLAAMSHEIRTPLNGVLGFADLLLKGVDRDDPAVRLDYLNTIKASGEHLLSLLNDILDLSRIEAGRLALERIRCSPQEVLAQVVSLMRSQAVRKGLYLKLNWVSEVPESIETDPARLRQMLMNLVGNAIKFTETGGVQITVRLDQATERLEVEVADTGIGISADKLEEIFDPFRQADNSVTRRFGGSGLGLAICRQLATALQGEIRVRSEVGQGSVFTLSVCIGSLAGGLPKGEIFSRQETQPEANSDILAGARILVVDDGPTNRKLIRTILELAGAEVSTAEDGRVAVELARSSHYDAILMDMQMPLMDGYTAARQLRGMKIGVPILALTAHAMKGDEEKCRAAGCSGYLTKPIDPDRLLQGLAAALAEHSQTEPLAPPAARPQEAPSPACGRLVSKLPTDQPVFREIVAEFAEFANQQVQHMRHALAAGNFQEVASLAHSLKGTGGTAGFDEFTQPSREIERLARASDEEQLLGLLDELAEMSGSIYLPSENLAGNAALV